MTVREHLGLAYRIDQRINSKMEQVANLHELAVKATATLSDAPRVSTRNVHSMESIIAKISDLEDEISKDIDTLVDTKRDIMHAIKRVDNPEYQTILEQRYLCYRTWEQIAVNLGYDLRYLHKLHTRALDQCGI